MLGVFEGRRLSLSPPQFNAAFHSMADVMPCRPLTLSGSYRSSSSRRSSSSMPKERDARKHEPVAGPGGTSYALMAGQTVRPWIQVPFINRYIKNASRLSSREAPLFTPLYPRSLSFLRFIRFIGLVACGTGVSGAPSVFHPVYRVFRLCHRRFHAPPHGFFAHFINRTL